VGTEAHEAYGSTEKKSIITCLLFFLFAFPPRCTKLIVCGDNIPLDLRFLCPPPNSRRCNLFKSLRASTQVSEGNQKKKKDLRAANNPMMSLHVYTRGVASNPLLLWNGEAVEEMNCWFLP